MSDNQAAEPGFEELREAERTGSRIDKQDFGAGHSDNGMGVNSDAGSGTGSGMGIGAGMGGSMNYDLDSSISTSMDDTGSGSLNDTIGTVDANQGSTGGRDHNTGQAS